ncbi:MAG: GNAT family N-acetyltransferase [Anaerolineae bacterium]|nr:GNAT family N-acetyltransferase [Anaerolineae bacterium]
MKVVRKLDECVWREFVNQHSESNVFHTPEMFQVFAHTEGHRPTLWATVSNDGHVLALLLPVQITLFNGLLRCLTTRAVAYGSVLCAPCKEGQEALTKLLYAYRYEMRGSLLFTELRNLSDMSVIQPLLHDYGFVYEDHLDFLVDLQRPIEEIWSSLDSNVRTNVRKARRMNVMVKDVTSLEEVSSAYEVLANVYERIQVPLAPYSLFATAFDVLHSRGMIKLLMAYVDDACVAVAVRLLYNGLIHAWYAGALGDYSKYKANDLLNWYMIEWGAQNGFKFFDFGGAGRPDQDYGPRKFKAKFNGALINYGRNICVHRPLYLRLSQWGYQVYRRYFIGN